MIVGIPKEIKNHEYRIGMTPAGVRELVNRGHQVLVETEGGVGVGFDNASYGAVGAQIVASPEDILAAADMIIKVKEPQANECRMLRSGQVLFTYLHLAPDPDQAQLLLDSGVSAIAYETVTNAKGGLPLLAPMSEVAGRMSIQAGAHHLEKAQGGNGMLLGGVPGVEPARVVVLGGGVVGTQAAKMAAGLGAQVTIFDRSIERLQQLDDLFQGRAVGLYSTQNAVEQYVRAADLVIGAVLIPGASAPKLVTRDDVAAMRPGAVLVDVAIDQGGCFETSQATTHQSPTYVVDDVVHYCVANMPGGVARTATMALTNATLPFALKLADKGLAALQDDDHLRQGLNVHAGHITHEAVAAALNADYLPADKALNPLMLSA
ncbi:alanine dehydrogenase [marine gamma proteobacterium HTCC2080]|nr:alanine dehydrogenase [marine gamma proteobacterium HTCC2080]